MTQFAPSGLSASAGITDRTDVWAPTADQPIKQLSTKQIYTSPWTNLCVDQVVLSDGSVSTFDIIDRASGVVVVPFCRGRILLVRQYRYPLRRWTLECPAGCFQKDELPRAAVARELQEETGFIADRFYDLGSSHADLASDSCMLHIFAARISARAESKPDVVEAGISAHWFSFVQVIDMIRAGQIDVLHSVAALSRFFWEQALALTNEGSLYPGSGQ